MARSGGWFGPIRAILINGGLIMASLVLLVVVLELGCLVYNRRHQEFVQHNWDAIREPDPVLGYRPCANGRLQDNGFRNGKPIYSAVYTTNAFRRRTTPVEHPEKRHKFLALFGCSITYGLCVNDDQTLGACLARRAPDYVPYNFGFQGYGPQQAMCTLEQPIENEIQQKAGIGLYFFECCHINRAIGAMSCVTRWGWDFPSYRLDGDTLILEGSFKSAHPWRQQLYTLLDKSQIMHAFSINMPLWWRESHYELVAQMMRRSSELFHAKFPGSEFYVVFRPNPLTEQSFTRLGPYLDRYGVRYLRYSPSIFGNHTPAELSPDGAENDVGHPSALANEIFSECLVRDLKLAE